MKIHVYDFLNKNKKATLDGSEFTGTDISLTIDDYASCVLTYGNIQSEFKFDIAGFDNIYVEDDDGNIIFGGIVVSYNATSDGGRFNAYDHRWVLQKLLLDAQKLVSAGDDILDVVEELINLAKSKREIPLTFSRELSSVAPGIGADFKFEPGDDIAGCLQKIIQSVYARWAVRYARVGDNIVGRLIVRSIAGITPEGVGIARTFLKSEDGDVVEFVYTDGNGRGNGGYGKNNLQSFNYTLDLSQYTSRTKIVTKIGDAAQSYDVTPNPLSGFLEGLFGRSEGFVSDYNVNSEATARIVGSIEQTYPRNDFTVVLAPNYTKHLNCGDRVGIKIDTALFTTLPNDLMARIDSISYSRKDGFFERTMMLNLMNPQKRTGTSGILQVIAGMNKRIDGLDKSYVNS